MNTFVKIPALILSISLLFSCSNDLNNSNDVNNSENLNNSVNIEKQENNTLYNRNGFDYKTYNFKGQQLTGGEIHNSVLKEVLINTKEERNGNKIHDRDIMLSYLENTYDVDLEFYTLPNDIQRSKFNNNSTGKDFSIEYINLVNDLVSDIKKTNGYQNSKQIALRYHQKLNESSLSEREVVFFKNTLSVLESSAYYWFEGSGGDDFRYSSNDDEPGPNLPCGAAVSATDVFSAAVGAATGGPAFVITGFISAAAGSAFTAAITDDCYE